MDNHDYLNKIATKPLAQNQRFFTPIMTKITIVVAAIIALIITLAIILGSISAKTTTLYQSFYLRLQNLSSDSGPIATYTRDIKSSQLRALAGTLKTTLTISLNRWSATLPELKVDPTTANQSTTDTETNIITEYSTTLQDAKRNGLLDRAFASSTNLQISLLIAIALEILDRNPPPSARTTIDQTLTDLRLLETRFASLNNS